MIHGATSNPACAPEHRYCSAHLPSTSLPTSKMSFPMMASYATLFGLWTLIQFVLVRIIGHVGLRNDRALSDGSFSHRMLSLAHTAAPPEMLPQTLGAPPVEIVLGERSAMCGSSPRELREPMSHSASTRSPVWWDVALCGPQSPPSRSDGSATFRRMLLRSSSKQPPLPAWLCLA